MKRCVIIGGAAISDYKRIKDSLSGKDFFIYCDSGLSHMDALGFMPDLIVGDFDSHPAPHLKVETIVLPCEKDDTDTVYAVKEAIARGFEDFVLIGVTGGRLDHTLGNVYILKYLKERGKKAVILDNDSEIELIGGAPVEIPDSFSFFSLVNITGTAKGINIENAKYNLVGGEIRCDYQYGVSNEVLPGKTARVSVKEGDLLLIKDY